MMTIFNLRSTLQSFSKNHERFKILSTHPHSDVRPSSLPRELYVLDSSFNPPTRAHLRICTSALLHDRPTVIPKRLLLLLTTQNADKAPKPAAFEQRLAMMDIFALELLEAVENPQPESGSKGLKEGEVIVDVGITKEGLFVNKADMLEQCWDYMYLDLQGRRKPVEQIHLTGFDTLIRLLDIKYYPPNHNLRPLESLFKKHQLRVTRRTDDDWGGKEAQDKYLTRLREGDREDEGGKAEWAKKIELVDGREEGEEVVSSTKVREAVQSRSALRGLVTDGVAKWICDERLYLEDP